MSARRHPGRQRAQRGALLIEVLIAVLICAFGLLGFAGMQVRATSAEFEAFQRSQALLLVEDMSNRINANRLSAASYVSGALIGQGTTLADCTFAGPGVPTPAQRAAIDVCEWGNLIRGSSETRAGARVGSMISARGCITRAAGSTDRYVVSVAWQGIVPTAAPASPCGDGDAAFLTPALRRTASSTVCVALLRDPAAPLATSRC